MMSWVFLQEAEGVGAKRAAPAADRAKLDVIAADAEFAFGKAHGRRAVAAAARLVKHQGPVARPQALDQIERGICGKNPVHHAERIAQKLFPLTLSAMRLASQIAAESP